jgi:DNA polymerase-3 subunit chi
MTEFVLYHLERQPLQRVLPALLEKSLERGWRVVVQAGSDERIEALDAELWTYRDESFLPHGTQRDPQAAEQPVLLTCDGANPNRAAVRFLIDGAPVPADAEAYERLVLLFDGEDAEAGAAARASLIEARARGFAVTCWRADAQGRWRRSEDAGPAT